LDLVDDLVGLHRQVLGQRAGFLMGEDEVQVFGREQGAVSVMGTAGLNGETAVEIFPELGQIGIASLPVRNFTQAQLLDQPILQGLIGAFDTSLGLYSQIHPY